MHLPTRVIDVDGNEQSQGAPFLCESEGEARPYICLSYCWGNIAEGFLTTTSGTLAQRKNRIGLDEFPQVFAEAIWIAKALDIQYLWIDSVCIVQDDAEDWARESAAMCDVYGNSYLTIAASEAPNAASGMFYALDDSGGELGSVRVTAVRPDGAQAVVNVRRRLPHWKGETASPLSFRGWTFQEGILPKRVVHLGLHELQWECNSISTCRCTINPHQNDQFKKRFASAMAATNTIVEKDRFKLWWDIVPEYTTRALTRGTDKLVALSGIAKGLQPLWKRRYLAGLWEDELLMGLRWQLDGYQKRAPRPTPFRAPTWSWASIDGHVCRPTFYYDSKSNFFQVTVLDVQCDLATNDPTGSLSGGYLTLSGKLVEAEYIYESHSEAGLFRGSAVLDSLYIGNKRETVQAEIQLLKVTSEGLPEVQTVYCLLLGAFGETLVFPSDIPTTRPQQDY